MYIVLGATGHVGSAVAGALLEQRQPVTIVTRTPEKGAGWRRRGAEVAVADAHDVVALRRAFQRGKRLFLLNPPAPPSSDTAKEETATVRSILEALDGSGIEKVVAQSTYGAHPGDRVGDLGVLYAMEQGLAALPLPSTIVRAAYYMSNWDTSLESAKSEGIVHALYPPDFELPMVAPRDIGQFAARCLTEPIERADLHYVEGPEHYSPSDVADAFADALDRPVFAVETPRDRWVPTLEAVGFSKEAAESMAAMTLVTLERRYPASKEPNRGPTSLAMYIRELAASDAA